MVLEDERVAGSKISHGGGVQISACDDTRFSVLSEQIREKKKNRNTY
jgi:hypothetical protein